MEVDASCVSFSGFSSEDEGLAEGRGAGAANMGAASRGAAACRSCRSLNTSSEHLSSISMKSSTSSLWSRAFAYFRDTRYSAISDNLWVYYCSFSSLSFSLSSEVTEYVAESSRSRFPISFSTLVLCPLIEE